MAEYSGFGATLEVEISSVFTKIANVRDISGPSFSQEAIDVSNRDARVRKYVAGMYDVGEITFDLVYDPDQATHSATVAGGLLTLLQAGTISNYKLKFADTTPTVAAFAALVTAFEPSMPYEDAQTASVTLRPTGAVTWT